MHDLFYYASEMNLCSSILFVKALEKEQASGKEEDRAKQFRTLYINLPPLEIYKGHVKAHVSQKNNCDSFQ